MPSRDPVGGTANKSQSATIKKRPALRELRQESSKPLKHKQSLSDVPQHNDGKAHRQEHLGPRTRRSYQNVQEKRPFENEFSRMLREPLEFGAINKSNNNGSSSRRGRHNGGTFEIHIPIESSSGTNKELPELPPRPRTSRGLQDGDKQVPPPIPSFTTMFPPAKHVASQVSKERNSKELPVSRFSMTNSEASSDVSNAGTAMYESSSDDESAQSTPRRSKFLEGSMNDRSQGVSSSWDSSRFENSELADITDNDEPTPKAKGRTKQKQTSPLKSQVTVEERKQVHAATKLKLEGREEAPNTSTIKTAKIHHFGQDPPPPSTLKKHGSRGLGLRSSISTFNFQGFSDKFKLFGSSKASKRTVPPAQPSSEEDAYKALMNERKRKAELAYAEQFGSTKKRKQLPVLERETKHPSTSSSTSTSTAMPTTATKPTAPHFSRPFPVPLPTIHSGTIPPTVDTHPIIHQASKPPTTTTGPLNPPAPAPHTHHSHTLRPRSRSSSISTIKKRPSRKDLEKENAHLRALLAAQQKQQQPGDDHSNGGGTGLMLQPGQGMGVVPGKEGREDIPPVPRVPVPLHKGKGRGKENVSVNGVVTWEWPEDCF